MNDIEQKALALIAPGAGCEVNFENISILARAFTSAIEQHEAFRQEVSDAVEAVLDRYYVLNIEDMLSQFIIPKPKSDPLVAVLHEVDTGPEWDSPEDYCNKIRAALEARGLTITTVEKD